MKSEFGRTEGWVCIVTVRKDLAEPVKNALIDRFNDHFSIDTDETAAWSDVCHIGALPASAKEKYKQFAHGFIAGMAKVMNQKCTDLAPGMGGDMLLAVAYSFHKDHFGSFQGNNFVECPRCLFHVHVSNDGNELIRHWGMEHDPKPITSLDDDRLR